MAVPAAAQVLPDDEELQPVGQGSGGSGWHLNLGIGAVVSPTYPGAKHDKFRAVPLVSLNYGSWLEVSPRGAKLTILKLGGLRVGPLVGINYGRKERHDPELTGLGDIPLSLDAGGFVSYAIGPFEARGEVRQAVTHTADGLTGKIVVKYRHWLFPGRLELSLGPELGFADDAHTRTWFGISADQSLASGLPVYTPHGGLTDVGAGASVTYLASRHILLRSFVTFRDIVGDASDSPIVQSKAQTIAGFGAAYHF